MKYTLEEKIQSPSLDRPERREFLRKMGLAGLAGFVLLAGCAGAQKDLKDPSKFDLKAFMSWYRRNKLYNGPNPNLRSPHSVTDNFRGPTFKSSIDSGWTPGIGYSVPSGEIMVAVASGEVVDKHELHTGRAGGLSIGVAYPLIGSDCEFMHFYAHLSEPAVKVGQKVNRGDPVAGVPPIYANLAKLMLTEGRTGPLGNWVDPDNYGNNHTYMSYWDGNRTLEINNPSERNKKQNEILSKFTDSYEGQDIEKIKDLNLTFHAILRQNLCLWSTVEKFRFFETLYEMHPYQFPNVNKEEFETMRKEFYENQPIVLTLPFRKGGYRG